MNRLLLFKRQIEGDLLYQIPLWICFVSLVCWFDVGVSKRQPSFFEQDETAVVQLLLLKLGN